ncbi:MAG TPA: hypothetical protein VF679_03395 [Pedobacter sp.]|jgi:hypothetical protein
MQNSKIIIVSGVSIDLSRIKAIRLNTSSTLGPTNVLKVDLNLKYEYIFNPTLREYEKQAINDVISIEYVDYNDAQDALENLTEVWQEYSENQEA